MQSDRNVEVLHHILGYCKEIEYLQKNSLESDKSIKKYRSA